MPQSLNQQKKGKMRRLVRDLAVLLILLSASCFVAQAALVRGRLLRGQNTAPGVAVTVWCQAYGRSQPSYSGMDGMYYMPNVPPGQYTLEIWAIPNRPPMTFVIYVNEPGFDVNPIYVP